MSLDNRYAVWHSDPLGRRFGIQNNFAFMNYQRFVNGRGSVAVAYSFDLFKEFLNPYFEVDRRIEVYRSPLPGGDKILEDVFWLRRFKVYTRESDGVQLIELTGRNAMALLDRRTSPPVSGTAYTSKTDLTDDMMKAIVRENMGSLAVDENGDYDADRDYTLTNQFSIEPDTSLGPSQSKEFARRNLHSLMKELSKASVEKGQTIYFDIVADTPTQFTFRTFSELRGKDRTNTGLAFSVTNGNIRDGYYEEDYFEERNFGYGGGTGVEDDRIIATKSNDASINQSPWARSEMFVNTPNSDDVTKVEDDIESALDAHRPIKQFLGNFVSVPGGDGRPSSLYRVDWDLGDKVAVNFADKNLTTTIAAIYISINSDGQESVLARNVIGA